MELFILFLPFAGSQSAISEVLGTGVSSFFLFTESIKDSSLLPYPNN